MMNLSIAQLTARVILQIYPNDYIDQLFLKSPSGKLSEDKILKLAELLDKLKDSKISLMLDVKSNAWKEVAELIVKKGWASRCLFLTFKTEDA